MLNTLVTRHMCGSVRERRNVKKRAHFVRRANKRAHLALADEKVPILCISDELANAHIYRFLMYIFRFLFLNFYIITCCCNVPH